MLCSGMGRLSGCRNPAFRLFRSYQATMVLLSFTLSHALPLSCSLSLMPSLSHALSLSLSTPSSHSLIRKKETAKSPSLRPCEPLTHAVSGEPLWHCIKALQYVHELHGLVLRLEHALLVPVLQNTTAHRLFCLGLCCRQMTSITYFMNILNLNIT